MKCKLSDICSFRKGKVEVENLNAKNYISTENMLPNKCGITEASSLPTVSLTQEYKKGDVLVSNIRPYFKKIWQAQSDGGCSNDVLVFVPKPNTDRDFLYYVLADAEFWDIEPSVFRNGMLSIEHKLMQIPLQKIPTEFKEFNTAFDIMTKYQHYGMCTRLLDLTTNPLVALYFACKCHGDESYINDDGEESSHEPYGVIYFTQNYYPSLPTDIEVQVVSTLARYDLTKENTVEDVFTKLKRDRIIDDELKTKWLQKDRFLEFVNIIQKNYMVTPTYTNERLRKQSGVFLLASLFTISSGTDIAKSVISKSKDDLRKEFEKDFFFVRGENKEAILKELDLYNINEATLFPELEHQLSYIKYVNSGKVQAVAEFEKYENFSNVETISHILNDDNLNDYIISNLSNVLEDIVKSDEVDDLKNIIRSNFTVDWYKRNSIISKIRMSISGYYFVKFKDKKEAKEKALLITERLIHTAAEYTPSVKERDD